MIDDEILITKKRLSREMTVYGLTLSIIGVIKERCIQSNVLMHGPMLTYIVNIIAINTVEHVIINFVSSKIYLLLHRVHLNTINKS